MKNTNFHVFEKIEVYNKTRFGSYKTQVGRISDWRNGIAIAVGMSQGKFQLGNLFYLIDEEGKILYTNQILTDLCGVEIPDPFFIERMFGGYYIVRHLASSCRRTYPGQDRDTDYDYYQIIDKIIDENGNVLSFEEKETILSQILYKEKENGREVEREDKIVELGENLIYRIKDSCVYELSNFKKIGTLKQQNLRFSIFKDGICKIYIEDDFRDLYVLVKDSKIYRYYDKQIFEEIMELIDSDFLEEKKEAYRERVIPPKDSKIEKAKLKMVCEIEKYLYSFPEKYHLRFNTYSVNRWGSSERMKNSLKIIYCFSGYYLENGIYYYLNNVELCEMIDTFENQKNNVPNFVDDVRFLKDVEIHGEQMKLYLFEIRPYGLLYKNGVFSYNFDVSNIQL